MRLSLRLVIALVCAYNRYSRLTEAADLPRADKDKGEGQDKDKEQFIHSKGI